MRILLIEDNPGDARLIREYLNDAVRLPDIELTEVGALHQALGMLAAHEFDVVLADLGLPDSNGLGTVHKIRDLDPDMPVVVMTGLDDDELGRQAIEYGAQDFLVKNEVSGSVLARALKYAVERKQAERELWESRERLLLFQESATDGFLLFDDAMHLIDINVAAKNIFNYDDTIIGSRVSKVLPDIYTTGQFRMLSNVMDTGEPGMLEGFRSRLEMGEHILSLKAFKVGEGLGVIVTDITERRQTEMVLKESEHRLRNVLESIQAGVVLVDAQTRTIVDANPAAEKMLGYSRIEMTGQSCKQYACGDCTGICPVLDKGLDITDKDTVITNRSGQELAVLKTIRRTMLQGQELLIESFTDISGIKEAEARIEKMSQFAASNPNPILEIDADGQILFQNDAADKLVQSFNGNVIDIILPERTKEIVKACLAEGSGRRHVELEKNGRHLAWSFYPISGTGTVHAYGSDISEKKKLEKQLVQSQKMEAVGSLAGGIAHDFNNLLTAIKGYAELAVSHYQARTDIHQDLQEIKSAAERAAKLTRQLLVFSRSEEVKKVEVDLNDVLLHMQGMLKPLLGENIEIRMEPAPRVWPVHADKGNIEQVIMNLAVNARDAMPDGGSILLRTRNVDRIDNNDSEARGRMVCFEITDSGSGMEPDTIARIFDPFFTTKGQSEGTGLGLAMVYAIVRQHGGWLNVNSEPGTGSVFQVYLPADISGQDRPAFAGKKANTVCGKGERVLLVEDEPSVREFAAQALAENGYTLFVADSVEQAMELFEREQGVFDLIFTDVILPDGNGPQMVHSMLDRQPDIQVIFGSGYTGTRSQFEYITQEGFTYMQKPYDLMDLLQTIREVITAGST